MSGAGQSDRLKRGITTIPIAVEVVWIVERYSFARRIPFHGEMLWMKTRCFVRLIFLVEIEARHVLCQAVLDIAGRLRVRRCAEQQASDQRQDRPAAHAPPPFKGGPLRVGVCRQQG